MVAVRARRLTGRGTLALAATVFLVLAAAGAQVGAGRAAAAPGPRAASAARLHPAAGVVLWHQRFAVGRRHRPDRAVLLRINLSARTGLRLDAAAPGEAVGGNRRTVAAQANITHAIAGINGDWFDMTSWAAVPRGGLIHAGHLLKSPRHRWNANFFVRQDGTAGIGPIPFHGRVTVLGSGVRPRASARVISVNTPYDAAHGRLVYVTHALVSLGLRRPCAVASGQTLPSGQVVTSVRTHVRDVARVPAGQWALVSCGGAGAAWLRTNLHALEPVDIALRFPDGQPVTAVSGGRVLLHEGRRFRDVLGQRLSGLNPETFACVSESGRSVLLGVVDGRSTHSAGVTQPQLADYLLRLHCWDAMTFDGGGSTTIVSRVGRDDRVTVLNQPSDGRPRPVADGLYVYHE